MTMCASRIRLTRGISVQPMMPRIAPTMMNSAATSCSSGEHSQVSTFRTIQNTAKGRNRCQSVCTVARLPSWAPPPLSLRGRGLPKNYLLFGHQLKQQAKT